MPEESTESFLFEVPVVGQHLRQARPAHGLHRDAVREAMTLVGAGRVKIEPGDK